MSALTWLVAWCVSGALVGWGIGARTGRTGAGVFLGAFMGVLGWVLILGAQPHGETSELAVAARTSTSPVDQNESRSLS